MAAAVAPSASLAAVPGKALAEDSTASTSADAGTGTEQEETGAAAQEAGSLALAL